MFFHYSPCSWRWCAGALHAQVRRNRTKNRERRTHTDLHLLQIRSWHSSPVQSSPGHGSVLHILDLKDESQAGRNHSIPWPWPAGNQHIELRIRRFVTINSNQAGHTRTNQSSNGRERRKKQERLICSYKYFKQAQGQESLPLLYNRTKIWPNKSIQQFNP